MHPINSVSRRSFLKTSALFGALGALGAGNRVVAAAAVAPAKPEPFKISLAQWSLNKRFLKRPGAEPLDNLEFAKIARSVGIDGIEYVNQMFKDKAKDEAYLGEMKKRAAGEGVQSLLIMCDGEGSLGAPQDPARAKTVENHLKWPRCRRVPRLPQYPRERCERREAARGRAGQTRRRRPASALCRGRQTRALGRRRKPRRTLCPTAIGSRRS